MLLSGVREDAAKLDVVGQLERSLREHGVRSPRLTPSLVEAIPKSPSGKTPLIKAHEAPKP